MDQHAVAFACLRSSPPRHSGRPQGTIRERLVQRRPDACSRRRAGVSVEPCPPRQCAAVARAAAHVALAAMRATTHVEGKPIWSSRRPRRGAGWWLRTTMAPPAGRRNRAARLRGGGRRRPVVLSQARMPRWTSRWGRGPLGHAQDDQETFDPVRRFAPAFARGCGRRHAPGRRARCSSNPALRVMPRRAAGRASIRQRGAGRWRRPRVRAGEGDGRRDQRAAAGRGLDP
jgi:hypothetical protein